MTQRAHRPRGRQRRERLLRAALEVIALRGVHATTHRAVAAAADVPVATTTYYFSSIEELLDAALELHVDDEVERLRRAGERVTETLGSVPEIIDAISAELVDAVSVSQFDLYVEASRRPTLRAAVERSLAAYRGLAESLLRRIGARDPERAAVLVVALLDGLDLQHLATGDPQRERLIAEGLTALLSPFLEGSIPSRAGVDA